LSLSTLTGFDLYDSEYMIVIEGGAMYVSTSYTNAEFYNEVQNCMVKYFSFLFPCITKLQKE